jgi:hypothetical protein
LADTRCVPGAALRLTSRADECAHSCRFDIRTVLDAGGFHRHKALKIGDLCPDAVRSGNGELALKTFPVVPFSAKKCHPLFDVTLQAQPIFRLTGDIARDTKLTHSSQTRRPFKHMVKLNGHAHREDYGRSRATLRQTSTFAMSVGGSVPIT